MKKLILASVLFLSAAANAQIHFDHKTGNSYNQIGNTTYGNNASTGSSWSTTNTSTGAYGTDSSGNSWNYNRGTHTYTNSNGTICTGEGQYRICN